MYFLFSLQCTVQVKLELGHRAQLRKKVTSEGFTHDWMVFVRGPETGDIQHFVEKVVFRLHESFPKPKRGRTERKSWHSCSLQAELLNFTAKKLRRNTNCTWEKRLNLIRKEHHSNVNIKFLQKVLPVTCVSVCSMQGASIQSRRIGLRRLPHAYWGLLQEQGENTCTRIKKTGPLNADVAAVDVV